MTESRVGGERTTCASTASSLNLRRANAQRPLTHSRTHSLTEFIGADCRVNRKDGRIAEYEEGCSHVVLDCIPHALLLWQDEGGPGGHAVKNVSICCFCFAPAVSESMHHLKRYC
jgi:hypothetical protein